ncbi:hypothetical protein OGAPHI_001880 [Ogataea philodendri]|uniref:U3 small nucleolar RNA-associated protein 4 n=1 Tax=Ogataea philodendri TaxID=1378263 RepID=A0A9P8PAE8_9ASCO|nr:uncharacterized protein OGAPHI_001880 [Ogataea philodendri]KAH3668126.1 hypothetical protein OGAPHI_001880 [Ogataea philodendri]
MDIHRCRFVDYTPQTVTSLAFSQRSTTDISPRNLLLAVGRADGSIELWNPRGRHTNWLKQHTIPGGKGRSVEGLVWCSDDIHSRLFSIGGSTYLTEWDVSKGVPVQNHDCNAGVIWSVAANQSQSKIAVGCEDGSVVIIDVSGGPGVMEHERILQRQQSRVLSLCWYKDEMIIGGCADGRIRCWDAQGQLVHTLRVDKSKTESTLVWSVYVVANSSQLVSGDSTGSVKFWDLKHFVLQQSFNVHEADVLTLTGNMNGTTVFSTGVDRKIYQFQLVEAGKKSQKWMSSSNRLLHGNDVRAMTAYESRNLDLLVSGGVERVVVVHSSKNFQNGMVVKLPINANNVIINEEQRLLVMWQEQTIKVWKFLNNQEKLLVAKLTLADQENITDVAISKNGRYLVVARLSVVRIFELIETDTAKLQVLKVQASKLDGVGAKKVAILDEKAQILLVSNDNEVTSIKFDVNDEDEVSEFDEEQELLEYDVETECELLQVSADSQVAAFASYSGKIALLDTESGETRVLVRLNEVPTALRFSSRDTLLVATLDHKLYEFNLEGDLHSEWSRNNSENMPQAFVTLPGQPYGIFETNDRFWVYGTSWLAFFDSKTELPQKQSKGKKRSRSKPNGTVNGSNENHEVSEKTFWFTNKYKNLLLADRLSEDELVVVERPVEEMPSPPAFKLVKYNI